MWRDARDAVFDMQQACYEVLTFATGIEIAALRNDTLRLRAIERSLSILGEAAKRVPDDVRGRWPSVPWRAMAGLREVLVHDYFGVDLGVLAQVVAEELPALKQQLTEIIAREGWSTDRA